MSISSQEIIQSIVKNKTNEEISIWLEKFLVNSTQPLYRILGPFNPFIEFSRDYIGGGDYLTDIFVEFLREYPESPYYNIFGDASVLIIERWINRRDSEKNIANLFETLLFIEDIPLSDPDKLAELIIELLNNPEWYKSKNEQHTNPECNILLVLGKALSQCSEPESYNSISSKVEEYTTRYPAPVVGCLLYLNEEKFFKLLPLCVRTLIEIATPAMLLCGLQQRLRKKPETLTRFEKMVQSEGWSEYMKLT